jgi:acyl carrier protein
MKITVAEIKKFIVEVLDLEDVTPDEIEDDQILFGEGLGLDSIDALEIGVALRKRYKVQIEANDPNAREYFLNAKSLTEFVNRFGNIEPE